MTKTFWEKEYKDPKHLTLSTEPAEDMLSFVRWTKRNAEWDPFPKGGFVLDIGCGNGRNIIPLVQEFGMKGLGIDIATNAIDQAKAAGKGAPVDFKTGDAKDPIPLDDQSCDIVLDMMTSHFLNAEERKRLSEEIARVIKPYGWLFFKTFIMEDDAHAKRLIREHPGGEEGTYIHPKIGVPEHVYTLEEIYELYSEKFKIHKTMKSYKHVMDGKPYKRRTVSVYMERQRD